MESPTTSYGIILYYKDQDDIKYAICLRRDQIAYVIFFRNQIDKKELKYYFSLMTVDERERLLKYSFDELCRDLIINSNSSFYRNEYEQSKRMFNDLKQSGELEQLLKETHSDIKEPEWGFPKGRKKYYDEEPLYCAIREFYEETHIPIGKLSILDIPPLIEDYTGTDGKHYRTVYYIAKASEKIAIKYRILNSKIRSYTVSEEISDILWRNLEESKLKFTPPKIQLLSFLDKLLKTNKTFEHKLNVKLKR